MKVGEDLNSLENNKFFDSKLDTIDQLISCVSPFNHELIDFYAPLARTNHVVIGSVFNLPENIPILFFSAVQETSDLYVMDIFFYENCDFRFVDQLDLGISDCLAVVLKMTKGKVRQLLIESNLISAKLETLIIAAGMKFITNFVSLSGDVHHMSEKLFCEKNFELQSFNDFLKEDLLELFELSSKNSLDCPEGLKLRNAFNVFESMRNHSYFDHHSSQVVLCGKFKVGLIVVLKNLAQGEIAYVGIIEGFRSRGLGKILISNATKILFSNNVKFLTVMVDEKNYPAMKLYLGFGMVPQKISKLFLMEG